MYPVGSIWSVAVTRASRATTGHRTRKVPPLPTITPTGTGPRVAARRPDIRSASVPEKSDPAICCREETRHTGISTTRHLASRLLGRSGLPAVGRVPRSGTWRFLRLPAGVCGNVEVAGGSGCRTEATA